MSSGTVNFKEFDELYTRTKDALAKLHTSRIDNDADWLKVGAAIHYGFEGSSAGLSIWDEWSKLSPNYRWGKCGRVYHTLNGDEYKGVIWADLLDMANIDSGKVQIKPAGKKPKPSEYMDAVHAMGFHFTMNSMNDRVYVNGNLMSDGLRALMMTRLREFGYKDKSTFDDGFMAEGYEHQFHPIREYLDSLTWDGKDYIAEVASHIHDIDGNSELYLRKWLIGAVGKVMKPSPSEQNPMWVIAGGQGWCKSILSAWFGSALPELYVASDIKPDNKDYKILACSKWIWEVKELSGTIRKSDVEALKAFVDQPLVNFRPPYGKYDVDKTYTASFIGTVNLDGNGFLNDPTGSRRFRVCELTEKINFFGGINKIDINQVWAQAMELWKQGETWMLSEEEDARVQEINARYCVEDPLESHIEKMVEVTGDGQDFVPSIVILQELKDSGVIHDVVERRYSMRVAAILTQMGAKKLTRRVDGKQVKGWEGLRQIGVRVSLEDLVLRRQSVTT